MSLQWLNDRQNTIKPPQTPNNAGDNMHLDSLKIQNFRLLEDVEVKKLGHVNLIVGKNNSGKSTVLEALALLASGFEPETVRLLILKRDFNNNTELFNKYIKNNDMYNIFDSFFSNKVSKNIYTNKSFIGNDNISLRIGMLLSENYSENKIVETGTRVYNSKLIKIDDALRRSNVYWSLSINSSLNNERVISLKDYSFFQKNTLNYIHRSLPLGYVETSINNSDELILDWDRIALTDDENLVVNILQLIEPQIQKIAFLSQTNNTINTRIPFVRLSNNDNKFPLTSMGDGIFRLLQIILKVLKAKDGFLLIDEFENGLHYSVQPEVWRLVFELAKRYNIQVFATTHSWDCIESFAQVAKEREDLEGVLFRMGHSVRKSDNGKVIATEFDEDELYNLTKDKIEVR